MTVISQKLNSLIGGVSQQPDSLKLPSQLRECDDFYPDPTFGLAKRPGIKNIRQLTGASANGSWFQITRNDEERFVVQIGRGGAVRVWDADSGETFPCDYNVTDTAAINYSTHTTDDDLEMFQINDYVLLLNRRVIVQKNAGVLTGARTPYAIVRVTVIGSNTDYHIQLNNQLYTFATGNLSNSNFAMDDLTAGLVSTINAGGLFTATAIANNLYIVKNDGQEFRVTAQGGTTGDAITAFYKTVSSPADLPRQFIHNATMQILAPEGGDDYWVIFKVANGGASGAGVWEETIAPNEEYSINKSTCPHALIREADYSFTFRRLNGNFAASQITDVTLNGTVTSATVASGTNGIYAAGVSFYCTGGSGQFLRLRTVATDVNGAVTQVEVARAGKDFQVGDTVTNEWGDTFTITGVAQATSFSDGLSTQFFKDRTVGSVDTNLWPSFINHTISGISFFKNRLILMSGENVLASAVGDYFNFFAQTVTTIDASDPIDISCGSLKPIDLRYALGTGRGLLLFADNAQYVLETTTEAFSAATAEINQISSYDISTKVSPVDMGPTVAFLDQGDRSCSVFEMLVGQGDVTTKPQIAELTRTVPSYLPSYVTKMKASTAASTLGIYSAREPNSLYLFRFYNVGQERQQAAWFRWKMPFPIKHFHFEDDRLYVVMDNNGSAVLGQAELITESTQAPMVFEGVPLDVRLDLHTYNPVTVYDAQQDVTLVCMPEGTGVLNKDVDVVRTTDGQFWQFTTLEYAPGNPQNQQWFVTIPGNVAGDDLAIGYRYDAKAVMPSIYATRDNTKDTINIPVVQRIYLDSYNSGPYRVRVQALGRNDYVAEFPQITANLSQLNTLPFQRNAQNVVPVMAAGNQVTINIRCPYPYPTAINSLTWTGHYNNRGIRSVSVS